MEDSAMVGRLTAIVAIGVVSFSTMSARDEKPALGLLRERLGLVAPK